MLPASAAELRAHLAREAAVLLAYALQARDAQPVRLLPRQPRGLATADGQGPVAPARGRGRSRSRGRGRSIIVETARWGSTCSHDGSHSQESARRLAAQCALSEGDGVSLGVARTASFRRCAVDHQLRAPVLGVGPIAPRTRHTQRSPQAHSKARCQATGRRRTALLCALQGSRARGHMRVAFKMVVPCNKCVAILRDTPRHPDEPHRTHDGAHCRGASAPRRSPCHQGAGHDRCFHVAAADVRAATARFGGPKCAGGDAAPVALTRDSLIRACAKRLCHLSLELPRAGH